MFKLTVGMNTTQEQAIIDDLTESLFARLDNMQRLNHESLVEFVKTLSTKPNNAIELARFEDSVKFGYELMQNCMIKTAQSLSRDSQHN